MVGGLPLISKTYTGSTIMNILIYSHSWFAGTRCTGESDFIWQRIHSSKQQEMQHQTAMSFEPPMQLACYHFAISLIVAVNRTNHTVHTNLSS